jgi:hypothetical protein
MAQGALLDEAKKQMSDLKKALGLIQVAGKEKKKKADGNTGLLQASGQPKERLLLKTGKVKVFHSFVIMYRWPLMSVICVGYDRLWFCRDVLPRTY